MIPLLKYGSLKKIKFINPSKRVLKDKIDNIKYIEEKFDELSNKGWYTYVNFQFVAFYKNQGKAYFVFKNNTILLDDKLCFNLKRVFSFPLKVNILIIQKDNLNIRFKYMPKQNIYQSFDSTFGYNDDDLDLISKVFILAKNKQRLKDFIENW